MQWVCKYLCVCGRGCQVQVATLALDKINYEFLQLVYLQKKKRYCCLRYVKVKDSILYERQMKK